MSIGLIGKDYGEFSCALLIEEVYDIDSPLDSPAQLRGMVQEVIDPVPGALVFVYFQGQVYHVAIIEEVTDSEVKVIEANGPNSQEVRRGSYARGEDISFGRV